MFLFLYIIYGIVSFKSIGDNYPDVSVCPFIAVT